MKRRLKTLVCTFCTVCVFSLVTGHLDDVSDVNVDNERMHDAVRTMLGFTEDPARDGPVADSAPQYMLNLYKLVAEGGHPAAHLKGNTVRSVQATIGES